MPRAECWSEIFNTKQVPPLASWAAWGWGLTWELLRLEASDPAVASLDGVVLSGPEKGNDSSKAPPTSTSVEIHCARLTEINQI